MADELDSVGTQWRPAAPRFFQKTTSEVCDAIEIANDRILCKHLSRIDDTRIRRAFEAAVGLHRAQERQPTTPKNPKRKNIDLWRGLTEKTMS